MSPPLVCPPPPDCPLYGQRLDYGPDEPLRRAILTARIARPNLADLIREEHRLPTVPRPALPPGTPPGPPSILDQLKEDTNEQSARSSR